jgi:hypothetical protein
LNKIFKVALAIDSIETNLKTLERAPNIATFTIGAFIVFKAIDVAYTTATSGIFKLFKISLAESLVLIIKNHYF